MEDRTLKESVEALKRSEEILADAEELMRVEKEVEPDYASGVPDFALARLEVDATEPPRQASAPDPETALKELRGEAVRTESALEIASEENQATPELF